MTRDQYAYPNRHIRDRIPRDRSSTTYWENSSWAYRDDDHTEYSDAYLLVQRDQALINFDLSMLYFDSLNADEFEKALDRVLRAGRRLKPVTSLPSWDSVEGCYVMVFDNYKQFYIGTAGDIRKRIKGHWSARKQFDRVLFGTPYDSIFPVDELRPLDTTRLYAARSTDAFIMEERLVRAADTRFCLNRMLGGEPTPLLLALTALNPRTREFILKASPMKSEEYYKARSEVTDTVTYASTLPCNDSAALLAEMSMDINVITQDNGSKMYWSRRDEVATEVRRGHLDTMRYAAFLEALGEHIIWPKNDPVHDSVR